MREERLSASGAERAHGAELVWLLGQPHLSDYLEFVAHKVAGGADIPQHRLTDEWRAANDLYYDLEQSEAGIADTAEVRPLPPELRPLARRLRRNPYFREAFDALPTRIAMVELDKLIVCQTHVERPFTAALGSGLGADPDPEALFRFCLPTERASPPVKAQRLSSDRWLFSSPSTDFRSHPLKLMSADQRSALKSFGPIAAALALPVGFGSNFLSAIRSGRRLLLQNGYHRAYALRALGLTRAPCVITEVTRKDELKLIAAEDVCADPEFYFAAARPPLLRDFFDPRIAKVLPVVPLETVIEVEIKVRTGTAAGY